MPQNTPKIKQGVLSNLNREERPLTGRGTYQWSTADESELAPFPHIPTDELSYSLSCS